MIAIGCQKIVSMTFMTAAALIVALQLGTPRSVLAQGGPADVPDILLPYLAEDFDAGGTTIDEHAAVLLARLGRALEARDLAGFLSTHTYPYFQEQMQLLLSQPDRKNGFEPVGQYSCEFLTICDVSKIYALTDIEEARLIRVVPAGDGDLDVTWRLTMTDGIELESSFTYSARLFGFFAAVG